MAITIARPQADHSNHILYVNVFQYWTRPTKTMTGKLSVQNKENILKLNKYTTKFSDMVTMDKSLNWLTFSDYGSIFNVPEGPYVSKLTLFMRYFLQVFTNFFQILRFGDHGPALELINFL